MFLLRSGIAPSASRRFLSRSRRTKRAYRCAAARPPRAGDDTIRVPILSMDGTETIVIAGREALCEASDHRILCAFLIDTLAIRNTLKSFDCFIGARSNRHSSGPLKMHQNSAGFRNLSPRELRILKRAPEKGILGRCEITCNSKFGGKL